MNKILESKQFYNKFYPKLIRDYVYGNTRFEAAISFALQWIPNNAKRVIDIGCGIGWSTWEIKRYNIKAFVRGIDLSEKMILTAQSLFEASNLIFTVQDITQNTDILLPQYDALVLLDVYEHIPKEKRGYMNLVFNKLLKPNGFIIMSCPSVQHQEYLRNYNPGGLQPVDEDVTEKDIAKIAHDLHGEVVLFEYKSIWNDNDYFHSVIRRGDKILQKNKMHSISLESKDKRKSRVATRLGIRVTIDGIILSNELESNICIVSPKMGAYSETFIRNHIKYIPANIYPLYGGSVNHLQRDDGTFLTPNQTLLRNFKNSIYRRIKRQTWENYRKLPLIKFLIDNKIEAVLAEYGQTGVFLMRVCQELNIPLIVHFHGYDAYRRDVLDKFGKQYEELFRNASALIVVSRDMKDQIRNLGAPEKKIYYNPCGVDTSLFKGETPLSSDPIFLGVGRFVDKKAPYLTIAAFKKVLDEVPETRLKMIGNGPLLDTCIQLARAWNIDHKIEFLGVRSNVEVANYMNQARAFVQHSIRPSNGDSEGTPVAILEAGASGLPVVATRHAGIKDVVIEGETGFLVDEGDVDGMAEYMVQLAKDPKLAVKLGRAGRKRIVANFSMEKSIENLCKIIERTIEIN